ncbi:MAG TPA: discoidin domain-containing protein, partial [Herpetosiphonaceae bacterium]
MRRVVSLFILCSLFLSSFATGAEAAPSPWAPNTPYAVGAQVTYDGSTYQCLQAHTSQVGWEPATTPALWNRLAGTPTNTPAPPTNTPTRTPAPPTVTPTGTAIPPTATATSPPLPGGWVATASSTEANGSPARGIDRNAATRWSGGLGQAAGQWYQVDLGQATSFVGVVLDAGASTGDYPRGYQLQVSANGSTWTNAASGAGSGQVTTIATGAQSARYVRVTLTASSGSWWSIHELTLQATPPPTPTVLPPTATPTPPPGGYVPSFCGSYPPAPVSGAWQSTKVFYNASQRLQYASDSGSNRIPDFSYAGYRSGERALPVAPAVQTLGPASGDNTARIQQALDAIGNRTPDANGIRGALLLSPGRYEINGTLYIRRGGVVLRGSGDGSDPATS